ncbi:hypothetical protein PYCC9005_002342 [Savitreella phatthalungensis]
MPQYFGYVDPNFPNPMGPNDARVIIYGYRPSEALAILAIVLFAIALIAHAWLLFRRRAWYFSTATVALAMEVVGYALRLLSGARDPYNVPYFVTQYFFIVVAPVFLSAALYTIVSLLIGVYGRKSSPIPPRAVLAIFITADVVATIVQIAGAALIGTAYSNENDPTTPNNILLAGLALQVAAFFLFLVLLTIVLYRGRKLHQDSQSARASVSPWFIGALVLATLLVYLRTVFRLAETAEGLGGKLSTREVFFGCLEFAPIVIAVYLLAFFHPGLWLPKPHATKASARDADVVNAREDKAGL